MRPFVMSFGTFSFRCFQHPPKNMLKSVIIAIIPTSYGSEKINYFITSQHFLMAVTNKTFLYFSHIIIILTPSVARNAAYFLVFFYFLCLQKIYYYIFVCSFFLVYCSFYGAPVLPLPLL